MFSLRTQTVTPPDGKCNGLVEVCLEQSGGIAEHSLSPAGTKGGAKHHLSGPYVLARPGPLQEDLWVCRSRHSDKPGGGEVVY